MRASVLIAAHNEGDDLWRTVRSCVESISGLEYELIVADDASEDGGVAEARRRFPQIRVVSHAERRGASPTKHDAALDAEGDVLVFLDGHCHPEPGAIKRLVEDVELLAGEAIVTPAVPTLCTKTWQNSRTRIGHAYSLTLDTLECRWIPLDGLPTRDAGRRRFHESPALIGCVLAIGRGLYHELQGFDADMRFWGVEDLDLGLKSWLMGRPILHDPRASVGHRFRDAFDNYGVPSEHVLANRLRMARKTFTSAVWNSWVERCRERSGGGLPGRPEGLWARAWELFNERRASVETERSHLFGRRTRDEFEYAEYFGLAWPRLEREDRRSAATSGGTGIRPSDEPERNAALVLERSPSPASLLRQLSPSPVASFARRLTPSPPPCDDCRLDAVTPSSATVGVNEDVAFTAEGECLELVAWLGDGEALPHNSGSGPTFTAKWATPGRHWVQARCGDDGTPIEVIVTVVAD